MPLVKVWIHFVWTTKNREPWLVKDRRIQVFEHIRKNAASKDIHVDHIGGYVEHVHCLISLSPTQSLQEIMQLLKGESSYWINREKLFGTKFGWQDEYFAASVSEALVPNARKYIANQETHHQKTSFDQEFRMFIKKAGFEKFEG
jgi:putative transposase